MNIIYPIYPHTYIQTSSTEIFTLKQESDLIKKAIQELQISDVPRNKIPMNIPVYFKHMVGREDWGILVLDWENCFSRKVKKPGLNFDAKFVKHTLLIVFLIHRESCRNYNSADSTINTFKNDPLI